MNKTFIAMAAVLLSLSSTQAMAEAEDANPWTCDEPPEELEDGTFRFTIVGERSSGDDGEGPSVEEEPSTIDVGDGDLGQEVTITAPSVGESPVDFEVVDPTVYGHPEEVVLVRGSSRDGNPVTVAVAPLGMLVFTSSQAANDAVVVNRVTQIVSTLRTSALRTSALQGVINQVIAAEQLGKPFSAWTWNYLQSSWRAQALITRAGLSRGFVQLGLLKGINGVILAGAAGWWAGSWIYQNSNWLQNGGLDGLFCAIDRVGNSNYVCP